MFKRSIAIGTAGLALLSLPVCAFAQAAPAPDFGGATVQASASVMRYERERIAREKRQVADSAGQAAPSNGGNSGPTPATAPTAPKPPAGGAAPGEITEGDVSKPGFLGDRFIYEADLSSMFSAGDTKKPNSNLPGGIDGSLIYRIGRTTRIAASYYQFSAASLGNDDPNIPIVFQGTTTPISTLNAGAAGIDATTHLRFQIYNLQQMFFVGGRHHPLVFAPDYAVIRSSIGGADDTGIIFANGQIQSVHQRSYQNKGLNLAIPLFYGEKYLISYTGGVAWNVNTNGANVTNHPQYTQTGYFQYQPDEQTTFFAQYQKVITYFPTDVYPYHAPTLHAGIAKFIKKPIFFEAEVSSGGPSNPNYTEFGRVGIVNLTVPCAGTAAGGAPTLTCVALANNGVAVPVVGAQRYTTFTLLFGIGNSTAPLVRPF